MFFECVFQVSFSKAFGLHFLDFRPSSASILKVFSILFEDAGNLEKWSPSHAKTRFGSFWGHIFSWFSAHVSRSVLGSTFYRFFIEFYRFWDSILAPWGRLSGVIFSGLKNCPRFFWFALLGPGYLGPHREKGGTERHLGAIWEASTVGFPP